MDQAHLSRKCQQAVLLLFVMTMDLNSLCEMAFAGISARFLRQSTYSNSGEKATFT